jgi:hypothetical protein
LRARPKQIWVIVLVAISTACAGPTHVSRVDDDVFRGTDQFKSIVAFDLRKDASPSCSLILHEGDVPNIADEKEVVVLPFPTSSAENDGELLSTWSSIGDCCSLASYIHLPGKSGTHAVALVPTFSAQPSDLSDLPGQIYFLRLGQERRFIYKYDLPSGHDDLKLLFAKKAVVAPSAIAIARPKDAKGLEVKNGMTEIPSRTGSNSVAAFYAGTSAAAGTDRLELRYELPLNSTQELALKFLTELFGAVAPPLGVLFFFDFTDKSKRRLKAIILSVLGIVELAVISTVAFLAWEARTTQSTEALLSSIVVLAGLAVSMVVAFLKKTAVGATD